MQKIAIIYQTFFTERDIAFGLSVLNGSSPCNPGTVVDHSEHSTRDVPGTLGYVTPGEFRDGINVPPLSNITVF